VSEHIEGLNRNQTFLLPETLEQYVNQDNPARFIDAFTEHLNLQNMGFTHSTPTQTGRPPYNPKDLLKLYIYGYLNQVRTSRKLERECHRNLEVLWLTKKLAPDHKTIADFRKDNAQCIKAVFKEFFKFTMSLDMYSAKFSGKSYSNWLVDIQIIASLALMQKLKY
jgi:transposase